MQNLSAVVVDTTYFRLKRDEGFSVFEVDNYAAFSLWKKSEYNGKIQHNCLPQKLKIARMSTAL